MLGALPQRIFGVMTNEVLLAIPLFIFMGVMLERSRIAEDLLETMGRLFGSLTRRPRPSRSLIVGVLLAAAKGIVGATTVTMGLIVLPTMLRHGYDTRLAAGTVAATATLAQIFPPATVLVLLGDQMSNAYQAAQLAAGHFRAAVGHRQRSVRRRHRAGLRAGRALSAVSDRHGGVLSRRPRRRCRPTRTRRTASRWRAGSPQAMVAPILLILAVLGSILGGIATPTEAASVGAVGAILLALFKLRTPNSPPCSRRSSTRPRRSPA